MEQIEHLSCFNHSKSINYELYNVKDNVSLLVTQIFLKRYNRSIARFKIIFHLKLNINQDKQRKNSILFSDCFIFCVIGTQQNSGISK